MELRKRAAHPRARRLRHSPAMETLIDRFKALTPGRKRACLKLLKDLDTPNQRNKT